MYKIHTYKAKDGKVDIHLDNLPWGRVPRHILAGVGDKKKRYSAYLEGCLNGDQEVLKGMAFIHKQGKERGDVCLLTNTKLKAWHAECIKEFLEKNHEFLDQLIPYLFPGTSAVTEGAEGGEAQTPPAAGMNKSMTMDQLPSGDRDQIMALIRADQEREVQESMQAQESASVSETNEQQSSS